MGLMLETATEQEFAALGQDGWPLAHYLLAGLGAEDAAPPVWQETRLAPENAQDAGGTRAALEALIRDAFES